MSRNALSSKPTVRNKFGSTSTNASSQVPAKQQLQTYTDHYRGRWIGKKSDFVNIPIYTYENLGSIRHIMVDKPAQLSTKYHHNRVHHSRTTMVRAIQEEV